MVLKGIALLGLLGLSLIVYGCGGVVNPYKGEFQCPQMENGKCAGVDTAYVESLQKDQEVMKKLEKINKENETEKKIENYYPSLEGEKGALADDKLTPERVLYAESYFNKLTKILKEPKTPVIIMPNVARILILPYQGDSGTLYFSRYVYVILEEPKWVLDNLLFDFEKEEKGE